MQSLDDDRFVVASGGFDIRLYIDCKEVLCFLRQSKILLRIVGCEKALVDEREGGQLTGAGRMFDRFDRFERQCLGADAPVLELWRELVEQELTAEDEDD